VREFLPRDGRCYDLVWLLDAVLNSSSTSKAHLLLLLLLL
jgi:hypothetical protein